MGLFHTYNFKIILSIKHKVKMPSLGLASESQWLSDRLKDHHPHPIAIMIMIIIIICAVARFCHVAP